MTVPSAGGPATGSTPMPPSFLGTSAAAPGNTTTQGAPRPVERAASTKRKGGAPPPAPAGGQAEPKGETRTTPTPTRAEALATRKRQTPSVDGGGRGWRTRLFHGSCRRHLPGTRKVRCRSDGRSKSGRAMCTTSCGTGGRRWRRCVAIPSQPAPWQEPPTSWRRPVASKERRKRPRRPSSWPLCSVGIKLNGWDGTSEEGRILVEEVAGANAIGAIKNTGRRMLNILGEHNASG